jgi:RNA polymerase sigma factor (sigma-70 family)
MEIDPELVVRAKRGETDAQEEIVARMAPLVFRLAGRFFRSQEDVEDLSQETFIRFFRKIDEIRPEDNVAGWVSRVTINVCYDRLRKIRREKLALEAFRVEPIARKPLEAEPYEWLWGAVHALDAKLQIPLLLKEVEELSIKEISDIMGISSSNVKIRLFRARKKLARILGDRVEARVSSPEESSP